jgi:hypothetical protein
MLNDAGKGSGQQQVSQDGLATPSRQVVYSCDLVPDRLSPPTIPVTFVPISPEVWNFQNIQVIVTVTPVASGHSKDFQDIIHISSSVHPPEKRCGVEIGIRDGYWVIGYNHGSAENCLGYLEVAVPEAELHSHQQIIFTKTGSAMRLTVQTPDKSPRSILWDVGARDLDSRWLLPYVVIGARTDGLQSDHVSAFPWIGTIHAFSVSCGAPPLS